MVLFIGNMIEMSLLQVSLDLSVVLKELRILDFGRAVILVRVLRSFLVEEDLFHAVECLMDALVDYPAQERFLVVSKAAMHGLEDTFVSFLNDIQSPQIGLLSEIKSFSILNRHGL